MILIRRINKEDHNVVKSFFSKNHKTFLFQNDIIAWGIFENDQLSGFASMELQGGKAPLLNNVMVQEDLSNSLVEGLLRTAFYFCYNNHWKTAAVLEVKWLENYFPQALDFVLNGSLNNSSYYEIDMKVLFNQPCKGRYTCQ